MSRAVGDLRFQKFLSEQVSLVYGAGWKGIVEQDVMDRAHTAHSLRVMDALRDAIRLPIRASASVTGDAFQYLTYGASRRLLMMWYAYRNVVVYLAYPRRSQPLSGEESCDLTRDLNVIYLNIRGTLDNLAWALLHERAPEKVNARPSTIGLFNRCITKDSRFQRLLPVIKEHDSWNIDLARRRDPSAHRIPLTIPPQVVTLDGGSQLFQLFEDFERAVQQSDFSLAEEKIKQTERIGRFSPCFIHDADEGPYAIYPTLPEDVAHTIEICREVSEFFSSATQADSGSSV